MKGIIVGCSKCGNAFPEVYPPDTSFTQLLSQPCKEGDSIKLELGRCIKCGTENTRYWDGDHPAILSL
jgi:predicted nucleic-acid-binding Zn-ribbon protein